MTTHQQTAREILESVPICHRYTPAERLAAIRYLAAMLAGN